MTHPVARHGEAVTVRGYDRADALRVLSGAVRANRVQERGFDFRVVILREVLGERTGVQVLACVGTGFPLSAR